MENQTQPETPVTAIPAREERRHHRGGGFFWPVILITAGIVFLLNNMGLLSWNVWELLLKLWPVALIAIGLDILIGRRSAVASLIVAVITIGALVGGVWFLANHTDLSSWSGRFETQTISQSLDSAKYADIEIAPGVGELRIGALAESSDKLVEGTIAVGENEHLTKSADGTGDTLRFTLKTSGRFTGPFLNFGRRENDQIDRIWDLKINREVSTQLRVDTGVGESSLNLERLNLSYLDVNTGVGKTTITLPSRGRFDAKVNTGIGEAVIRIPEGMAARIRADAGLGGVDVSGNYRRGDKTYTSPNYDSADNRVDLQVNGGIGRITVEEYKGQ